MTDGPDGVRLMAGQVDLRRNALVADDGTTTSLTTKEGALLSYLASREGEDVSRDDLLVEVWGYRRGVATRAIDAAVQRLRSKIEVDPAHPKHLLTVTGVGYRFVGLTPPPEVHLVPAAAPSPSLRLPDDGLHGRDADHARLAALVGTHRLVTVLGPAGIGKTRLATSVAENHPGGAVTAELDAASTADAVRDVVAAALGSPLASGGDDDDPDDLIAAALSARGPTLLLLDNLEQVIDDAAPLTAAWLAGAPDLTVLTTSREPLRIAGEVILDLAPLDVDAAVDLFVARARAAHPAFDQEAAGPETLRALVTALDELPLAIELAAARAGLLTPVKMLNRLNDRFALLVSRRRDVPGRQLATSERIGDLRMTSLLLTDLSAVLAETPLEVRARYSGRRNGASRSRASWAIPGPSRSRCATWPWAGSTSCVSTTGRRCSRKPSASRPRVATG
ncbi:MAG: AAA family ATPase [Proteobacteria bacterium]|nr:AAA family ATPase [Pseudomonadota bacterium]